MGGIGFFLGGIGPDGHVGFNVRGSDHYSTTRLTATNYETQAAAAGDLGGIEISRNRLVITIGLNTITYNPRLHGASSWRRARRRPASWPTPCKARPACSIPASALRSLPQRPLLHHPGRGARNCGERQARARRAAGPNGRRTSRSKWRSSIWRLARQKRLLDLTAEEAKADPLAGRLLGTRPEPLADLRHMVHDRLVAEDRGGQRSRSRTPASCTPSRTTTT